MTEDIRFPEWVNDGFTAYQTRKSALRARQEELEERIATDEEITQAIRIREDTERLRNEDWVDRYHGGSRMAALGPALISLALIFGLCLIVFALVWIGGAWLNYYL